MKCTITIKDEVYSYISGLSPEHHGILQNHMKRYTESYRFDPRFKLGVWDGKISFIGNDGKIYTRLLCMVESLLSKWGYEVDLQDQRKPVDIIDAVFPKDWFKNKPESKFKHELREYQVNAINACLQNQCGFIEAATGAGKTWMAAGLTDLLASHGIRSIIIVPSDDLVGQTVETMIEGAVDVGVYSGSKKDVAHDVVIATWQSLQNNPHIITNALDKDGNATGFGAIIVDEAHGAKAKVIGDLLNITGRNIPYRIGFTGTIPKPEIDRMTLIGSIGEVLFTITAHELMEMGYLADLNIQPYEIQEKLEENFPDYASEKAFLSASKPRLELLADLAISKTMDYGNTLILVSSVKQGKALQKLIKDSVFLHGADDTKERKEWYDQFETRDDLIVIATYGIASTGISIDRIFHLMMIDAGKSFRNAIQSVGRSLRVGGGKTRAELTEIYSNTKWSKKHWAERKKFYKEAKYNVQKPIKISA